MKTICSFILSCFCLILSSNSWADPLPQNTKNLPYRSEKAIERSNFSDAKATVADHQKRQLSKDEKQELRRQVNEAGSFYSKKK